MAQTNNTANFPTIPTIPGQTIAMRLPTGNNPVTYYQPSFSNIPGRNLIVNAQWAISQAAGGVLATVTPGATGANAYICDCWQVVTHAAPTAYTFTTPTTDGIPAFKFQRNAGAINTDAQYLVTTLDSDSSFPLKQSGGSLGFMAKKGANFSAANSNLQVVIVGGGATGINAISCLNGAFAGATLLDTTVALTTDYQYFQFAIPALAANAQIGFKFGWTAADATAAGADDSFTMAFPQAERSPMPTPFEYVSFNETLAKCKVYYTKSFPYATVPAINAGISGAVSTTSAIAGGNFNGIKLLVSFTWQLVRSPTVTLYDWANQAIPIISCYQALPATNVTATMDAAIFTTVNGFGVAASAAANFPNGGASFQANFVADARLI